MAVSDIVKTLLKILGLVPFGNLPFGLNKLGFAYVYIALVFSCMFFFFVSSVWYFVFRAETFTDYSESGFFSSTSTLTLILYSVLLWKKTHLIQIINKLERIIEERSCDPAITPVYVQTSKVAKVWSTIVFTVVFKVYLPLFEVPMLLHSLYKYAASGGSTESFQLLYIASFPWNWMTLSGYFCAIGQQALAFFFGSAVTQGPVLLHVEMCTFLDGFVTDMEQNIGSINRHPRSTTEERFAAYRKLCELISFDAEVKRFINELLDVYRVIITIYVTFSFSFLCTSLLGLNVALEDANTLDLVRLFVCLTVALSWIYIFCHFGGKVTTRFLGIPDLLYQCAWYEFPLQMKQLLPHIIRMNQKPIFLTGFMNIHCTREFFKKIINTAFSYFTILRGIAIK